jgi:predicted nucleic acid-binding Zn ribbon protein
MRAKYLSYGKRREPTEISDVLGVLVERASGQIDVRQGELIERWKIIAPGDWPEVSTPIGIRGQTLLVEVASGTAASLLKYQTHQLVGAIRDAFGEDLVTSVKLRVSS